MQPTRIPSLVSPTVSGTWPERTRSRGPGVKRLPLFRGLGVVAGLVEDRGRLDRRVERVAAPHEPQEPAVVGPGLAERTGAMLEPARLTGNHFPRLQVVARFQHHHLHTVLRLVV